MLVAVVFPKVLVHVTGDAAISGSIVAVSGEVAMLGPIKLFHIDAVLSLFPFLSLSLPLACFESHFVVVPVPCLLSLSITCLCCLFVYQACSAICLPSSVFL